MAFLWLSLDVRIRVYRHERVKLAEKPELHIIAAIICHLLNKMTLISDVGKQMLELREREASSMVRFFPWFFSPLRYRLTSLSFFLSLSLTCHDGWLGVAHLKLIFYCSLSVMIIARQVNKSLSEKKNDLIAEESH